MVKLWFRSQPWPPTFGGNPLVARDRGLRSKCVGNVVVSLPCVGTSENFATAKFASWHGCVRQSRAAGIEWRSSHNTRKQLETPSPWLGPTTHTIQENNLKPRHLDSDQQHEVSWPRQIQTNLQCSRLWVKQVSFFWRFILWLHRVKADTDAEHRQIFKMSATAAREQITSLYTHGPRRMLRLHVRSRIFRREEKSRCKPRITLRYTPSGSGFSSKTSISRGKSKSFWCGMTRTQKGKITTALGPLI